MARKARAKGRFSVSTLQQPITEVMGGPSNPTYTTAAIHGLLACKGTTPALWQVFETLTHMEQSGKVQMVGRDNKGRWCWRLV